MVFPMRYLSSSSKVTVCTYRQDFVYANTMPLANRENKHSFFLFTTETRDRTVQRLSRMNRLTKRILNSSSAFLYGFQCFFLPPPVYHHILFAILARNFRTAYRRLRVRNIHSKCFPATHTHVLTYILSSRTREVSKTPTNPARCGI